MINKNNISRVGEPRLRPNRGRWMSFSFLKRTYIQTSPPRTTHACYEALPLMFIVKSYEWQKHFCPTFSLRLPWYSLSWRSFSKEPMRRSKSRVGKMWKSRYTSILPIWIGTALAIPRLKYKPVVESLPIGARGMPLKRVSAENLKMILARTVGLWRAFPMVPPLGQVMVVEGEIIQITSEECLSSSDHNTYVVSVRIALLGE